MDFDIDRNAPRLRNMIAQGTLIVGLMLVPALVVAANDIEAAIEVGVTYSDNIALEVANEESEVIYRISPSFKYLKESDRILTSLNYRLDGFYYSDLGESEVYHQFDGKIEAALIPENLFLDIGATRYQSIKDPDGKIPADNLPVSVNRVNRDEYYVGPRYQGIFGRSVTVQGNYRLGWVEYDDADVDNIDQHASGNFVVQNYRRGTGLTWAARYGWQRTEYDDFDPWENQQASVELGYWAGKNTRVFASGGKESAWDMPLDPSLEDSFWEAGFAQQVGKGFSVEFAAGDRTFGSSWRGSLEYEFKNGSTTLGYTELPTTEGRRAFNPGRLRAPDDPNDFLARPGSGERYVLKRFLWVLNLNLQHTNVTLVAFDGERTDRTEADGAPLMDADQRGLNLTAIWQVGVKTDLEVRGRLSERDTDVTGSSVLKRASITAKYRLGSRTRLSLGYEYAEEDDDRLDASTRDYVENSVTLLFSRTF